MGCLYVEPVPIWDHTFPDPFIGYFELGIAWSARGCATVFLCLAQGIASSHLQYAQVVSVKDVLRYVQRCGCMIANAVTCFPQDKGCNFFVRMATSLLGVHVDFSTSSIDQVFRGSIGFPCRHE